MLTVLAAITALQAAPVTVLPGVLDLPLIEGTTVSADCMGHRAQMTVPGKPFECLADHMAHANEHVFAYVAAAQAKGWVPDTAAANGIFLRRTLPNGVCQKLAFIGLPGTQAMRPEDPAYILIAVDPAATCPSPSAAP